MNAVFAGSFDPVTAGHEAIIRRALALFDKVYVAVGVNSEKQYMFTVQERLERIGSLFPGDSRVEPVAYSDMTADLCRRLGCRVLLRGIRNADDLAYEQTVATVNRQIAPDIETVILLADSDHQNISSTIERERIAHTQQP